VRILIDTDILLDVVLLRQPHFADSAAVVDWAEAHPGSAAVSWHCLANLHYLSKDGARDFIGELLDFCEVPATGSAQMHQALSLGFSDLKDAMQVAAAILFGGQLIVTRNIGDYRLSPIRAIHPKAARALLR